ncbi:MULTISPECIES: LysR substrate-binding domain-containing protein [Rhizobium/Agrobacterium group]|uniref:Transcriptional regulator LysR family n=2 Tax=Rhizobium/Agrobacterium group TaxID=227290 RepID=B9K479_ALLAM|nr:MULTISPECIES: LysR substrate-binding domain-containing protein [Rhizobium/Agrobacterium group]ACM39733.1 transcriptional regulator LysR family [Allorhizobium ampelinum S4]ASK49757.1 LysR family transcriptional regulator [Agrobacterium vitis]NSX99645.1 LysR family transcriptional regulator [Agrobacterium vitis]NSZ30786.1 LysR family transcriptional regulator [Agrobacterium vitis]NSZ56125.1 LysR family transcriptional regulator [Agrobacterium vitis]
MISQRALEAFRAVMTTGTVSAAAEELNVSQPAVSRLVRDLEEYTQLRLFSRHGGRIVATREAHEFNAEIERSFLGLRVIEQAAREIRQGRRGTVSVAVMPALAQTILPDVMADVRVSHPDFRLELLAMPTQSIVRQVATRQCPLGLTSPTHHANEVDVVKSGSLPYRCVMPDGHPLAAYEIIRLQDLSGMEFINYTDATATGRMLDHRFAHMTTPPVVNARAPISPVIAALVRKGLGVAILDPFTAQDHVNRGGVSRPVQIDEEFHWSFIKPYGEKLSSDLMAVISIFEDLSKNYA